MATASKRLRVARPSKIVPGPSRRDRAVQREKEEANKRALVAEAIKEFGGLLTRAEALAHGQGGTATHSYAPTVPLNEVGKLSRAVETSAPLPALADMTNALGGACQMLDEATARLASTIERLTGAAVSYGVPLAPDKDLRGQYAAHGVQIGRVYGIADYLTRIASAAEQL